MARTSPFFWSFACLVILRTVQRAGSILDLSVSSRQSCQRSSLYCFLPGFLWTTKKIWIRRKHWRNQFYCWLFHCFWFMSSRTLRIRLWCWLCSASWSILQGLATRSLAEHSWSWSRWSSSFFLLLFSRIRNWSRTIREIESCHSFILRMMSTAMTFSSRITPRQRSHQVNWSARNCQETMKLLL